MLLETSIASGKLVCGHCGHEYGVKEGIGNFLLPSKPISIREICCRDKR